MILTSPDIEMKRRKSSHHEAARKPSNPRLRKEFLGCKGSNIDYDNMRLERQRDSFIEKSTLSIQNT
jgi:hypothetical protein